VPTWVGPSFGHNASAQKAGRLGIFSVGSHTKKLFVADLAIINVAVGCALPIPVLVCFDAASIASWAKTCGCDWWLDLAESGLAPLPSCHRANGNDSQASGDCFLKPLEFFDGHTQIGAAF
jgi:hypothetical protein